MTDMTEALLQGLFEQEMKRVSPAILSGLYYSKVGGEYQDERTKYAWLAYRAAVKHTANSLADKCIIYGDENCENWVSGELASMCRRFGKVFEHE